MTHWTSTDVIDLLDETPRDNSGLQTVFVPLDEGDSTWDPTSTSSHLFRAKGGGSMIGVVYVRWPDGGISARYVPSPLQPTKTSRKA